MQRYWGRAGAFGDGSLEQASIVELRAGGQVTACVCPTLGKLDLGESVLLKGMVLGLTKRFPMEFLKE